MLYMALYFMMVIQLTLFINSSEQKKNKKKKGKTEWKMAKKKNVSLAIDTYTVYIEAKEP